MLFRGLCWEILVSQYIADFFLQLDLYSGETGHVKIGIDLFVHKLAFKGNLDLDDFM